MADLDRIVSVTITRQTTTPSEASFDDVLIAAEFLTTDVTPPYASGERVRLFGKDEYSAAFGAASVVTFMLDALFSQNPSLTRAYVGRKLTAGDGTETWTAALDAMQLDNPNWYGLLAAEHTIIEQELIADWTETNTKLYGISSPDANVVDGTGDIAEYLDTNNYERSFVLYHPDAGLLVGSTYPAEAWMGERFPSDPGSSTWAYKTLAGVAAYALTASQIAAVEGKNGNYYTSVAGVAITQFGTVGTGEYIDIIRGTDKLQARIQTLVFSALINNEKIPFTNGGIQIIVGKVKEGLQDSVDEALLDDTYIVTAPDVADISAANKAARNLPDVEFTATYQGAIHKVEITGTISL